MIIRILDTVHLSPEFVIIWLLWGEGEDKTQENDQVEEERDP